jgi:putative transposase
MMLKVHKIALDINNVQATHLTRCAGTARFAYNWALSRWTEQYKAHLANPALPKPSQQSLRRELNAIKREQFPWMLEVSKCVVQEAIIDLGRAYANFFARRAAAPIFHKRGVRDSFRISSGFFKLDGKRIRLPHVGWLRLREELRFPGAKPLSVTISRRAARWYASVTCEVEEMPAPLRAPAKLKVVGIDVGLRAFCDSYASFYELPRAYRRAEAKLRRLQQSLSGKQKGSANYRKQKQALAKTHAKVADIRSDFLHKLTTNLVRDNDIIVIEDLNVKGMIKNHHLAKSISDAAFGEFRRQITYKCSESHKTLIVADRFFASSKLCSTCGAKTKHLPLCVRSWKCSVCGSEHDRDLNAAINLKHYAADSLPVPACGEFFASDAVTCKSSLHQAASVKQELSIKSA